jgi:acyl-coenzyme A synthetase/AMP-(fatty) acid ligase
MSPTAAAVESSNLTAYIDWLRAERGVDVAGGVPTLPVYRGELQARALGCKVEAWDEEGNSVTGEVGELVITERGTAIIHGRSDSTINRGGIRIGTAEIYRAVLDSDDVLDALVVDLPKEGTDGVIELFVVLREGAELDDDLKKTLARQVRERTSPRHVPDRVRAVAQVPRTLSGKVVEVPEGQPRAPGRRGGGSQVSTTLTPSSALGAGPASGSRAGRGSRASRRSWV